MHSLVFVFALSVLLHWIRLMPKHTNHHSEMHTISRNRNRRIHVNRSAIGTPWRQKIQVRFICMYAYFQSDTAAKPKRICVDRQICAASANALRLIQWLRTRMNENGILFAFTKSFHSVVYTHCIVNMRINFIFPRCTVLIADASQCSM